MNDLAITVGTVLVPAITSLVAQTAPLINWLTRMAEEHPTLVKNLALASVALLGLGVALIGVGSDSKGGILRHCRIHRRFQDCRWHLLGCSAKD